MVQNDVITGLNDFRVAQIKALLNQLKGELPFLIQLTKELRKKENAVAEGRLPFVLHAAETVENHGAVLLMTNAMIDDIKRISYDFKHLSEILGLLDSLHEGVSDTTMRIGANCYEESLMVRDMVALAIRRGVPGMETIYDELSTIWERGPRDTDQSKSGGDNSGE